MYLFVAFYFLHIKSASFFPVSYYNCFQAHTNEVKMLTVQYFTSAMTHVVNLMKSQKQNKNIYKTVYFKMQWKMFLCGTDFSLRQVNKQEQ